MKSGFTLIELLLVIAIIFILTTVVIVNYESAEKEFALKRSANKLAQEIRKTQQMAMSAEQIGKGIVPSGEEFYPEGGYGVRFEEENVGSPLGEITIFADCDNNHQFTSGSDICAGLFSEKIKDIELETDIKIKSISPFSVLDISFKAPKPSVYFFSEGIESTDNEAIITISLLENGKTKTVKINKVGLIEAE